MKGPARVTAVLMFTVGCSGTHATAPPPRAAAADRAADIDAGTPNAATEETPSSSPTPGGCTPRSPDRACLSAGIAQVGRMGPETRFEERPPRAARLRSFEIDRDEVSATAYAACVAAGACAPAHCDDGRELAAGGPARCIAWRDARAFCASVGGRLPTEAEWERAAAGVLPGHRLYPWGDAVPGDDAAAPEDRTPEHVLRLGAGVAEWVDDVGVFYLVPPRRDGGSEPDTGAAPTVDTSEREVGQTAAEAMALDAGLTVLDDPRGPHEGTWRVVRGGDDTVPWRDRTTSRRRFRQPDDRRGWIGFRCAFDLP